MSQQTENLMRKIFLSKVVLNMGVGKSGDPIEIGKKTLMQITGKKPNTRNAKKSQRDWGIRKGEPIGVAVTVRNNDAVELLKKMPKTNFDETVELSIHLGVDSRQSDQMVRGVVDLPNGSGKKVRVIVFTDDPETALEAGADYAGKDDII